MSRPRVALAALLLCVCGAREEAWPDEDLWYTVRIADAPVGSLHTTVSHAGGRYTSTEAMHVLVHRGDDLSEMVRAAGAGRGSAQAGAFCPRPRGAP